MNSRIALVIGNSEYQNVGKLNNPKNDAIDIETVLNKLNFDVTRILDADLNSIQESINIFLKSLDSYSVGLFFYAGHGTSDGTVDSILNEGLYAKDPESARGYMDTFYQNIA